MIVTTLLFIVSLLCFVISIIIDANTKKIKKTYSIQSGKIIYSDLNKKAETLFSKKYMIAGKPDYIVNQNGRYIPVELKTGNSRSPQINHILQLAAYCHLIEENYNSFVPYGILVYNNKEKYKVDYTPKIRFELESTVKKMQKMIKTNRFVRNHNEKNRCRNCSMKEYCNYNII